MSKQSKDNNTERLPAERPPVVYIAGKVTGLPQQEVYTKFMAKQLELENLGFMVLNPCNIIAYDTPWDRAMRIAIGMLCTADFICLLPDWHLSAGAKVERELALVLNIPSIDD
jgi:hypothetical protein